MVKNPSIQKNRERNTSVVGIKWAGTSRPITAVLRSSVSRDGAPRGRVAARAAAAGLPVGRRYARLPVDAQRHPEEPAARLTCVGQEAAAPHGGEDEHDPKSPLPVRGLGSDLPVRGLHQSRLRQRLPVTQAGGLRGRGRSGLTCGHHG